MADPQCSDRQMSDEEQPEAEQPRISPIFGGLNFGGRGFGREPIIPPGLADIISQVTPIEYEAPDFVIEPATVDRRWWSSPPRTKPRPLRKGPGFRGLDTIERCRANLGHVRRRGRAACVG